MATQPSFTYTENFNDIDNWTFNTSPTNGTFTAGTGAAAWKGFEAATGTGSIPNATRITAVSNFFQTPPTGGMGSSTGVFRISQAMVLLSTGTTDNTTSIAMDLFLDFTGLNAGTLSFNWASLNNSTGNRTGSLRVYATTDNTNFTEVAQVLNFVNGVPTTGSVVNVSLPASFNNASTARLRFYYHNGTGGTTGSRPRISIDDIKITALPTATCTQPTAQPTGLVFNNVIHNAINLSFTPATPTPQGYLVVMSTNNALTAQPVNNTTYNVGDNLGDGTVVSIGSSTSISVTGLNLSTTYYFFIYAVNNLCTGGPLYRITSPLTGNATTLAGALPCTAPNQPTALTFTNTGINTISGSFTASNADEYIVLRSTAATFTGTLNNGTTYNAGNTLGNGTVVARSAANSFIANGLSGGTNYYFFVFGLTKDNCTGGPVYNKTSPLTASNTTTSLAACTTPATQPTALLLAPGNTTINGSFTAATSGADYYLVIRSTTNSLSSVPANGTSYTAGASFGGGTIVYTGNNTSFIDYNLTAGTPYHYFVFAYNNLCNGGPLYRTALPLYATATTTTTAAYNYYYGTLHAHSSYSDGNQDNAAYTPADDYLYAKNSLCMDFLGISEHNHSEAGMFLTRWQPGITQAAAATTANFLALYGMEWGVISNGGHVLVYGVNQLIGWETGNYNVYVPKSNYTGTPETNGTTGLFRTINTFTGGNAFATLAHPASSDYNNISSSAVNITADSAIVGSAVASGPAFSTSTTYNDPPSSMAYLDYFQRMLSRGYHLAPNMDHDSHNTNFGRANTNRLVVIAPSIGSSDFFTAMKQMHFYATEDCDTRVNFSINNNMMGSLVQGSTAPGISIYAYDPTNASAPSIKLMYGIAGIGVLPVQIAAANGNTLSYTDNNLPLNTEAYYYADISIGGYRTITAPIWYTRTGPATPVTLLSFTASLLSNRTVSLNWTTTNEINNKAFVVQRSFDGIHFTQIADVAASGSTQGRYQTTDLQPQDGINYYRLVQTDNDGRQTFSQVVSVNLKKEQVNAFTIEPNPVASQLSLNINSASQVKASIVIADAAGRTVTSMPATLYKGNQRLTFNVQALGKGTYYVNVQWPQQQLTQKMLKL
jgi:hypothetical protein